MKDSEFSAWQHSDEWKDGQAEATEGYPGIAHDFETTKSEIDRLRAINAELVFSLREMDANCENRQDEPFIAYIRNTCRAALAKAGA